MSPPPHLLYLSAGPARNTTSGALLMHRHFSLLGNRYELHCAHEAAPLPGENNYIELPARRLYQRLLRTRFSDLVRGLDYQRGFFHSQRVLRGIVRQVRPAAILTVTEGSMYYPARTIARAERIPLVAVFHDWSPGWPDIPAWSRAATERAFRRTYRDSTFAFCVSEELRDELGPRPNSAVLLPIPDPGRPRPVVAATRPGTEFFVLYAGVFNILYAPEMKALCRALAQRNSTPHLRVIGPDPGWPENDTQLLRQTGVYHGFHKGTAFRDWLERAPAFLVISPFDREFEWYARYSFPSKIPECCQYGKPMVIWGPPFSAAVRWARRTGGALVVESPSPDAVVAAINQLACNPSQYAELAAKAAAAANTEFAPARLQRVFEDGLTVALGPSATELAQMSVGLS